MATWSLPSSRCVGPRRPSRSVGVRAGGCGNEDDQGVVAGGGGLGRTTSAEEATQGSSTPIAMQKLCASLNNGDLAFLASTRPCSSTRMAASRPFVALRQLTIGRAVYAGLCRSARQLSRAPCPGHLRVGSGDARPSKMTAIEPLGLDAFHYDPMGSTKDQGMYVRGGFHPVKFGDRFRPPTSSASTSGRYRVLHKLGFGSFATVWLARDLEAGCACDSDQT